MKPLNLWTLQTFAKVLMEHGLVSQGRPIFPMLRVYGSVGSQKNFGVKPKHGRVSHQGGCNGQSWLRLAVGRTSGHLPNMATRMATGWLSRPTGARRKPLTR